MLSLLKRWNVFRGLPLEALERLASEATLVSFVPGEYLIKKGDHGDCMYAIVEGEVEVRITHKNTQAEHRILRHAGDLLGEMALLTGQPRAADVIATSRSRCIKLTRQMVERSIEAYPSVAQFLTELVGERLRVTSEIQRVGKYEIRRELERGGMSYIYDGYHPSLKRAVAIKMLSHELAYHPQNQRHFRREARLLARLHHPHIVKVYDMEEAYGTFFIVMEKLSGITMRQVLEEKGPFSFAKALRLARQVASALRCAHDTGIIHRDLKPSNIMLDHDGNFKLIDFGVAAPLPASKASSVATPLPAPGTERDGAAPSRWQQGTLAYMAPEQIQGEAQDPRTDIYALGIVLYELLTGEHPFGRQEPPSMLHSHIHTSPPALREKLPYAPDFLEALIQRATAKDPAERFQDCQELLSYIDHHASAGMTDESEAALHVYTLLFAPQDRLLVQEFVDGLARRNSHALQIAFHFQELPPSKALDELQLCTISLRGKGAEERTIRKLLAQTKRFDQSLSCGAAVT